MKNIESLLKHVKTLANNSKELAKLKGENFNVFSVLQIESKENNTHSRFLAELLSPKGSHGLNHILLDCFISKLPVTEHDEKYSILQKFDSSSAKVTVERYIGKRDDIEKAGGRIDIEIKDKNGLCIFIENKIYAKDQNVQIERYCNYNNSKGLVLYLTLYGNEPDDCSKGELESGKDFYCISYQDDITKWLEDCQKEATDNPILRETIKQYSILLKKLTKQLTNHKMTKEVRSLISKDLESAEIIAKNFEAAKSEILDQIRNSLKEKLLQDKYISEHFTIKEEGSKVGDKNSKLWFHHKSVPESLQMYFGIEPFSGRGNRRNHLFIGIIDIKSAHEELFKQNGFDIVYWWRDVEKIKVDDKDIFLSSIYLLQKLSDSKKREEFINKVAFEVIKYIKPREKAFLKVCEEAEKQILLENKE